MNFEQLATDVEFLSSIDGFDAESIDEVLNTCENLGGISAEYFCEEFVLLDEERYYDENYLKIQWGLK